MKLIRYNDLVEKGVVNSRMTLKRLIDTQDFPPGVLITPNARAWDEDLVDAWIAARPAARKPSTRKLRSDHVDLRPPDRWLPKKPAERASQGTATLEISSRTPRIRGGSARDVRATDGDRPVCNQQPGLVRTQIPRRDSGAGQMNVEGKICAPGTSEFEDEEWVRSPRDRLYRSARTDGQRTCWEAQERDRRAIRCPPYRHARIACLPRSEPRCAPGSFPARDRARAPGRQAQRQASLHLPALPRVRRARAHDRASCPRTRSAGARRDHTTRLRWQRRVPTAEPVQNHLSSRTRRQRRRDTRISGRHDNRPRRRDRKAGATCRRSRHRQTSKKQNPAYTK